jgi:hypothetical protein
MTRVPVRSFAVNFIRGTQVLNASCEPNRSAVPYRPPDELPGRATNGDCLFPGVATFRGQWLRFGRGSAEARAISQGKQCKWSRPPGVWLWD